MPPRALLVVQAAPSPLHLAAVDLQLLAKIQRGGQQLGQLGKVHPSAEVLPLVHDRRKRETVFPAQRHRAGQCGIAKIALDRRLVDVHPIGLPRGVAIGLQAGELQHVGLHGGRSQREAFHAEAGFGDVLIRRRATPRDADFGRQPPGHGGARHEPRGQWPQHRQGELRDAEFRLVLRSAHGDARREFARASGVAQIGGHLDADGPSAVFDMPNFTDSFWTCQTSPVGWSATDATPSTILIVTAILVVDGLSFGARYFASTSSTLVPSSRMTTDAFVPVRVNSPRLV